MKKQKEKIGMNCKHSRDKIVHGIYHNYQWCPDCDRTRGKARAFRKPKKIVLEEKK